MRGIIGKFLSGVDQVAKPAALEQFRADIQRDRDQLLQQYHQQDTAANQTFQSSERVASQDFTSSENAQQRQLTHDEKAADRTQQQGEFDVTSGMKGKELGMEQQKLDMALQQADLALKTGKLGLIQTQQVQGLRDAIVDPKTSAEDKAIAATTIGQLSGSVKDSFEPITAYGAEGELGQQTKATGVLNKHNGQMQWIQPPGAGGYNTPDDIRAAYKSGKLTKQKATELLQHFDK